MAVSVGEGGGVALAVGVGVEGRVGASVEVDDPVAVIKMGVDVRVALAAICVPTNCSRADGPGNIAGTLACGVRAGAMQPPARIAVNQIVNRMQLICARRNECMNFPILEQEYPRVDTLSKDQSKILRHHYKLRQRKS